jgi:hypothetical protein
MHASRLAYAVLLAMMASATPAQQLPFDGKSLWHRVEILAADSMEGREPGTAGFARAQSYVVEQLRALGLSPAGVDGYFQPVGLVKRAVVGSSSSLTLRRGAEREPLVLPDDAFFTNDVVQARTFEAPLVFVGYGLRIREKNYDDFAGLDLRGKIAVTLPGTPDGIAEMPLGSADVAARWRLARELGLAGWVDIAAPEASWQFLVDALTTTTTYLAGSEFNDAKGQPVHLVFNPTQADKLFEGTGHTAQELIALEKARQVLPRFPLAVRLSGTTAMRQVSANSTNIVAKLEGSDPRLRNEYVVFSAHLDHLGIRSPVKGDSIYNGAIDNASGVAALLDIAAALKKEGIRPKRSVLFAFFTAEEGGQKGSQYFVRHPTVDRKSIIADINIDEIQATVPLRALLVFGADESSLGDATRRIAASYNLPMDVDLEPLSNRFISSSDQGSFALAGIPALSPKVGFPGDLAIVQRAWRRERKHTPFDDAQQPIDFATIAKYEEITRSLLLDIANNPQRPEWNASSIYRRPFE